MRALAQRARNDQRAAGNTHDQKFHAGRAAGFGAAAKYLRNYGGPKPSGQSPGQTPPRAGGRAGQNFRSVPSGAARPTGKRLRGGACNQYVEVGKMPNGEKVVFKGLGSKDERDREILATSVGKALDAPVAEAVQSSQLSSREVTMPMISGEEASRVGWIRNAPGIGGPNDIANRVPGGKELGLLDYITRNTDRHYGNFIVTSDGKAVGIDHGFTFKFEGDGRPLRSSFPNAFLRNRTRWDKADAGTYGNRGGDGASIQRQVEEEAKGNSFGKAWLESQRPALEATRQEFMMSGHQDWYTGMMRRYEALVKGAR